MMQRSELTQPKFTSREGTAGGGSFRSMRNGNGPPPSVSPYVSNRRAYGRAGRPLERLNRLAQTLVLDRQ